jgi:hypothetical protein
LVEHLTARASDPSREVAAAAVLQMGLNDEASGRTFRRQIYDWSRARDKPRSLANVLVVACRQMSQTHPAEALVRLHQARQLAAGWALAFARLPDSDWGPRANDWFTHAAEDDVNRHALLNVLVDGARQVPGVLPHLYGLAHHGPFRDVIADPVLERISAVQGVELP